MFSGFLEIADECGDCGLPLGKHDSGDGPVAFIILIVGIVVVGLALWVEIAWRPAYWIHAALWLPLILMLTLGLVRPLKGLMIALQYRHRRETYDD
jgi:uncharacterized protein (DUF983 family)